MCLTQRFRSTVKFNSSGLYRCVRGNHPGGWDVQCGELEWNRRPLRANRSSSPGAGHHVHAAAPGRCDAPLSRPGRRRAHGPRVHVASRPPGGARESKCSKHSPCSMIMDFRDTHYFLFSASALFRIQQAHRDEQTVTINKVIEHVIVGRLDACAVVGRSV